MANPGFRHDKGQSYKRHTITGIRIEWTHPKKEDMVSAYKQLMGLAEFRYDENTVNSMNGSGTISGADVASTTTAQCTEADKGVEGSIAPVLSQQRPHIHEGAQNSTTYRRSDAQSLYSLAPSSDNNIFASCFSFGLSPETPWPIGVSTRGDLDFECKNSRSSSINGSSSAPKSRPLDSARTLSVSDLLSGLLPEGMTPHRRRHSLPPVTKYPDDLHSPMDLLMPTVDMEGLPRDRTEGEQTSSAAASIFASKSSSRVSHRHDRRSTKPMPVKLRRPPSYPVRDAWSSRSISDLSDSTYLDTGTSPTEASSVHRVLVRKPSDVSLRTQFNNVSRANSINFTEHEPKRTLSLPRVSASPAFTVITQSSFAQASESESCQDGEGVTQAVYAKIVPVRQGSVTTLKRKQGRYRLKSAESIEDYFATARGSLSESHGSDLHDNEPPENDSAFTEGTVQGDTHDNPSDKGDDQALETSSSNYDNDDNAESPDYPPPPAPPTDASTIASLASPKHTIRRPLPQEPVTLTPPRSLSNLTRIASTTPSDGRRSQRSQRSRFEEHLDLDGPSIYRAGANSPSALSLAEAMAFRCPSLNLSLHVGSVRSLRSTHSYEYSQRRRGSTFSDTPTMRITGGQSTTGGMERMGKETEKLRKQELEERPEQGRTRSKLLCQRTLEAGKKNFTAASKKVGKMGFVLKLKGKGATPGPRPALKPDWGPV